MDNIKVCVIGAGCSGITAIKNLVQAGIKNITCFEQNDQIGGNWVYTAEESHSSVCETTHIISSKKLSGYLDFPMPDHYPDYPSHQQVLAYFQEYCKEFDLEKYIQFNSTVKHVFKGKNNSWSVELTDGTSHEFDFLLISNGHHSVPRHPEFKDDFAGEYMHSHLFKNNKGFEGKRVLVIGAGNSACDCAVEISRVAEKVDISIRTPQYILPKFFMGKPTDVLNDKMMWVPASIRNLLLKLSLKLQLGKYEDYGLQKPKHSIISAHPTLNSELLYKIWHGKVKPRVGIKKVKGKEIYYLDGSHETYDTMVAATGYKIATPFFDPDFLDYSESDRIELYLRMFHPEHPTLVFIGLTQPQGAIWPLSDLQAKLAANYIAGRWKWPENMTDLAKREADEIEREFLKRKRHSVEVHYHDFVKKLKKEIPKDAPEWVSEVEEAVASSE